MIYAAVPFIIVLILIPQPSNTIMEGGRTDSEEHVVTTLLNHKSGDLNLILKEIFKLKELSRSSNLQLDIKTYQNNSELIPNLCSSLTASRRLHMGLFKPGPSNMIESIVTRFNVPYLTWDRYPAMIPSSYDTCVSPDRVKQHTQPCHVFSVQPDLTQPLVDMLVTLQWNKFTYVYSTEDSFKRMRKVETALERHYSLSFEAVYLPYEEEAEVDRGRVINILKLVDGRLSSSNKRHVVLDTYDSIPTDRLFGYFELLGMIRREYHYLLMDYSIQQLNLTQYRESGVCVMGFHHPNFYDSIIYHNLTANNPRFSISEAVQLPFILDTVALMSHLASKLSRRRLPLERFVLTCWQMGQQDYSEYVLYWRKKLLSSGIPELLKQIRLEGHTGRIQFDSVTCKRINFSVSMSLFDTPIGEWTENNKWTIFENSSTIFIHPKEFIHLGDGHNHSSDFQDGIIRVVTILSKPYMMYRKGVTGNPTTGNHNFIGYCKDLLDVLFRELHLQYKIHLVSDRKYGSFKNGTWNGIIGELVNQKADIAVAPLTVSTSREKVVDFSEPFMTFGLTILIKKPEVTKTGTFGFLKPLSHEIWITIVTSWVCLSIGLHLICKCSPYQWKTKKVGALFRLRDCFWYNLAAFTRQGIDYSPKSTGARILISVWWYFSLVIGSYYTANLVAFLTIEIFISPIKDIRDLVEKRHSAGIRTSIVTSGTTMEYFTTAAFYPYKELYSQMMTHQEDFVKDIFEGVNNVRKGKGKHAFLLESKTAEYFNNQLPCDTMVAGEHFSYKNYAVAFQQTHTDKYHVLKDNITDAILLLKESQELLKLYQKWWIDKGNCTTMLIANRSKSRPLALNSITGVFYILITGLMFAISWAIFLKGCQKNKLTVTSEEIRPMSYRVYSI